MTVRILILLLALSPLLVASPARAQETPVGAAPAAPVDLAAIMAKAGAGDAQAQVALGGAYAAGVQPLEALRWYKKAAAQGNVEGEFQLGRLLLFGAPGLPGSPSVPPDPTNGLRWTFAAATNLHPMACWNMSKALRRGIGADTNLVEAHAWLTIFAQITPGSTAAHTELNELSAKMDAASIQRARDMARKFNAGEWRSPVARAEPAADPGLRLGAVFYIPKSPLAMINGQLFSQGETAKIAGRSGPLIVKCLKIEKDSVIVEIDGEEAPRLLRMH